MKRLVTSLILLAFTCTSLQGAPRDASSEQTRASLGAGARDGAEVVKRNQWARFGLVMGTIAIGTFVALVITQHHRSQIKKCK